MNPQPITSIHQIELASDCNLRCVYCPSRVMDRPLVEPETGLPLPVKNGGGYGRPKEFLTDDHFFRALDWAVAMEQRGTQGELAFTGIGEALLHPRFVDYLGAARRLLPANRITFSTNGILLTDDLCSRIAQYKPEVYISLHRPEKAKHAIDAARKYGILAGVNQAFATDAFDWADKGQGGMDWAVSIPKDSVVCEYLRSGWSVVLADGRITTCCLDAEGAGVVGHVDDEIGSLAVGPWEGVKQGCSGCHMVVPG